MKRLLFLSTLAVLLCGTATAQTPDGQTQPNEGVCDVLIGATEGLYGLCIAFCEIQECVPDFFAPDPFANCEPPSPNILDAYNDKRGPDDPAMPCFPESGCPCWSLEELWGLRYPSGHPQEEVFGYLDRPVMTYEYSDEWNISRLPKDGEAFYRTYLKVDMFPFGGELWYDCWFADVCRDSEKGDCLGTFRGGLIHDEEQYSQCKAQLYQAGLVRGIEFIQY